MNIFWSNVFKLFVFLSLGASVLVMGWPWYPFRWLGQVFFLPFRHTRQQEGTTETVIAGPVLEEAVYSDPQQYSGQGEQQQQQGPPDPLAAAFVESQLQLAAEARASQPQPGGGTTAEGAKLVYPPSQYDGFLSQKAMTDVLAAFTHGVALYGALPDTPVAVGVNTKGEESDEEKDEGDEDDRPFLVQVVTVNGERIMTSRTRVSYYTVVHWAFPGFTPEEIMDLDFVVTYRFGPPEQRNGSLRPGESVPLLSGMDFFCMGKQHYSV